MMKLAMVQNMSDKPELTGYDPVFQSKLAIVEQTKRFFEITHFHSRPYLKLYFQSTPFALFIRELRITRRLINASIAINSVICEELIAHSTDFKNKECTAQLTDKVVFAINSRLDSIGEYYKRVTPPLYFELDRFEPATKETFQMKVVKDLFGDETIVILKNGKEYMFGLKMDNIFYTPFLLAEREEEMFGITMQGKKKDFSKQKYSIAGFFEKCGTDFETVWDTFKGILYLHHNLKIRF